MSREACPIPASGPFPMRLGVGTFREDPSGTSGTDRVRTISREDAMDGSSNGNADEGSSVVVPALVCIANAYTSPGTSTSPLPWSTKEGAIEQIDTAQIEGSAWWVELDRRGLASGHAWAPCDVCGVAAMQPRDGGRRCFMTPGCKGTHRPPADRPTPLQAYRAGMVDRGTMLANLPVVGATLRALLTRSNDAGARGSAETTGGVGGGVAESSHPVSPHEGGVQGATP